MSGRKSLDLRYRDPLFAYSLLFLGIALVFASLWTSAGSAQSGAAHIRLVQALELDRLGIHNPAGLVFSQNAQAFQVLESHGQPAAPLSMSDISIISAREERIGWARIPAAINDPINMTFDDKFDRLLIFQANANELIQIKAGADGGLNGDTLARFDARRFGLKNPQGMAVDPVSGELFILDSAGPSLVRIAPAADGSFEGARIARVGLKPADVVTPSGGLRGLAFDPSSSHLHVLNSGEQALYEITEVGQVVATRDLSGIDLGEPQGMVFAPSGDLTDEAMQMDLYIADGSQVAELSFSPMVILATTASATLVQTIDTSAFVPPSPDTCGIAYINASDSFLFSDSEVDEIPALFTGDNLFEMTASGTLLNTTTTLSFSNEPTGVAYNPANDHAFFSDDVGLKVYEVTPGIDGQYGTSDDTVTDFDTDAYNSGDPEGITFDSLEGALYIVDGINAEVYKITPGANGVFDGVAPVGDDQVSQFDTASLGITDPEGITYNTTSGNLFIVGKPATSLLEITTSGALVRMLDISEAKAYKPAGLGYGPSSLNAGETDIYITERGKDNDLHPNENDGKIYEFSLPAGTPGNQPPSVDAGDDETITLPQSASLAGSASDDGLPNPPGALTLVWSKVSGPGTVVFADANALSTTASFSSTGTYVLRLTAKDGELMANDDLNVTVERGNAAPIAGNDNYATNEDTALNVTAPGVLGNDSDADSDPLTADLISDASHGSLNLNADGSFNYAPDPDFNGTDTFTYVANDGRVDSEVATVSIVINAINDIPVVSDDNYSLEEDAALTLSSPGVLINDNDPDGDPLTANLVGDVSNGDLALSSDGAFTYTPNPNFNGTDAFTYRAYDGQASSNLATVTITVQATSDAPTAGDDVYATDKHEQLQVTAPGVLANDDDPDGDSLTAVLVGDVTNGELTLDANGSFIYDPNPDFSGMDAFTYRASDGTLVSNLATVRITVKAANKPPTAADDAYTTDEGVALNVSAPGPLGNDSDPDGDPLTASFVGSPSHGTLSLSVNGSFTYMPQAGFAGMDSFTYVANDGTVDSNIATVTIQVKANTIVYMPLVVK